MTVSFQELRIDPEPKMNYGQIYFADSANGTGMRTSLFVSGCTHHCRGCFNQETWDFSYGEPFTSQVEDEVVRSVAPDYIEGLTILGGEPMEAKNQYAVCHLVERIKKETDSSTWIYSGYTWDELFKDKRCHTEYTDRILSCIDILVDGEFKEELKDISLNFRGSSNQRIIDVRATLEKGEVVLSPLNN